MYSEFPNGVDKDQPHILWFSMVHFKSFAGPMATLAPAVCTVMSPPWNFFFAGPDRNTGFPLGQHERTGGQTGGQVGRSDRPGTDGSGGWPADGGPEYSMPALPDSNLNLMMPQLASTAQARGRPGPPVRANLNSPADSEPERVGTRTGSELDCDNEVGRRPPGPAYGPVVYFAPQHDPTV